MTLNEAAQLYVERRRAEGVQFSKGQRVYQSLSKCVGDLRLSEVSILHIQQFLERPGVSVTTFRKTHSLLRHFFDYWRARGLMPLFQMPPNKPRQRSYFLPHIYTKEELRGLLRSTAVPVTRNDKIHHRTLRMAITMLYATGATSSEVAVLSAGDVDTIHGFINFHGNKIQAKRRIPIGTDLIRVARQYAAWKDRSRTQSDFFLSKFDGEGLDSRILGAHFRRLSKAVPAVRRIESSKLILRDLRPTFAVHQIARWIKKKEDLNRMLPALAAYMGNVCLESTERYLQLTPERFQNSLNKLSPSKSTATWRDDPAILDFLIRL